MGISFHSSVFVIFLLEMANGLDTCKGPFEPPTFLNVSVDLSNGNWMPNGAAAYVKLEVASKVPVTLRWSYYRTSWPGPDEEFVATEDNEMFRSTVDVDGERYVFTLRDRIHKNLRSAADIIGDITTQFAINYGCNTIHLPMKLADVMEMAEKSVTIPTIAEMPRQRYILNQDDDDDDETIPLTTRFVHGNTLGDTSIRLVYEGCIVDAEQKNGHLTFFRISGEGDLNSTLLETDAGYEMLCQAEMENDVDSSIMSVHFLFNHTSLTRLVKLYFDVEVRRQRDNNRPAMLLEPYDSRLFYRNGEAVVPGVSNGRPTNKFSCSAAGYTRPSITVARVPANDNGNSKKLTPISQDSSFHATIKKVDFKVQSPEANEEEEYVCRAESGGEVASLKFKVAGYIPVRFMYQQGKNVLSAEKIFEADDDTPMFARCEASGIPTPKIRFYAGVQGNSYNWPDPEYFPQKFAQNELLNSANHEIKVTTKGNKVSVDLYVRDVWKDIEDLPNDYWVQKSLSKPVFLYICLAYNDFSAEAQKIAEMYF